MPNFAEYESQKTLKMLLIGASGSGKTGAMASLAKAGFNLRFLDFDNGLTSLREQLKNDKEALARVTYETCTDVMMTTIAGSVTPKGIPTGWTKALGLLNHWKVKGDSPYDLGSITKWGANDILIIDSLTHASNAAMRRTLAINNRSGKAPHQSDYGSAMNEIEGVLALLYSDAVPCNVIITSHVTYIGGDDEGKGAKGYPSALGQKLPPKVGSYFDVTLLADTEGAGVATKRVIHTVPSGLIGVKNPFVDAKKKYSLETGLAEYFSAAGITAQKSTT